MYNNFLRADVAQLVEYNLAKVGVAGSNPVVRSIQFQKAVASNATAFLFSASKEHWLSAGTICFATALLGLYRLRKRGRQ